MELEAIPVKRSNNCTKEKKFLTKSARKGEWDLTYREFWRVMHNCGTPQMKALMCPIMFVFSGVGEIPLTIDEMSEEFGIGRTTVVNALKGFRERNMIQRHRGRYYINPILMNYGDVKRQGYMISRWIKMFDTLSINERGM